MSTRRPLQLLAALLVLTASRWAAAQVGGVVGYAGLPSKANPAANNGVQLSDGVLMHAGIGAEIGYDSNVFYSETDPQGSPILRVLPYLEFTNASRSGVVPSGVFFDLNLGLTYREYFSNDEAIQKQRAFMPSASGLLEFSSNQSLSFSVADTFVRIEDPPYSRDQAPFKRNMNLAAAQLRWAPGGGRLQTLVRYTNVYDKFDDISVLDAMGNPQTVDLRLDSLGHELMLDLSWRWLPKTAIFLRASQGYIMYLDANSQKSDSYPLRVLVGLRGLVTRKTSVNLSAGYTNAFYDKGPTTRGLFGSLSATAEVAYMPTILNSLNLGFRHDFYNSVLGNFYYIDTVYGWFQQQIAGRVSAVLSARYERRRFQLPDPADPMGTGAIDRNDNFVQAGAAIDYHAIGWFYTGVGYSLVLNDSDGASSTAGTPSGANYVKHQIFARLGVTY